MSDYIGTGILEVCECPESNTDLSDGFGWVLGGKNRASLYWHLNPGTQAPESVADRCNGLGSVAGVQNRV